ncbi:hypothetical protein JW960_09630 [candidate division KSB1 bacterium]|nr:hypothetical protein [candidate division KSB1 bacterium]
MLVARLCLAGNHGRVAFDHSQRNAETYLIIIWYRFQSPTGNVFYKALPCESLAAEPLFVRSRRDAGNDAE